MSITWLPREQGMVVRCDGCPAKYYTGNISATNTRAWIAKHDGWGRGSRVGTKKLAGTKRHDLCPPCLALDKELHAKDLAEKAARKEQRDANRKAKMAPGPKAKKPRKKKPAPVEPSTVSASSPSADSHPAPAT